MSVGDDVREAFQGKRGKVLIIGGGIAIAAYVWWTRVSGSTPEAEVIEPEAVVEESPGRTPQTDPEVGNSQQGSVKTRPTTNLEWLSDGTDFLRGRGTPSGTAYDVLNRALGGEQLTEQEKGLVSQVIGALGSPPEGMPPMNSSPTTPPTGAPSPPRLHHVNTTSKAAILQWSPGSGASTYTVYKTGGSVVKSGIRETSYTVTGLKPNTSYSFSVASVNSAGKRSGKTSNVVTVRTKK